MRSINRSLLFSLFLSLLFVCGTTSAAKAASERPNILFIAVDDMNDWNGVLGGNPQSKTPHMEKLASKGMVFTPS